MVHSLRSDNAEYEAWLRGQCDVVEKDLEHKHERMRKDPFVFLRATYFRWSKCIERLCPELADAPKTLSVGDTHVENFGTWRDAEGRLVWGINDFDEASAIAYSFDLVRLAASARLSPKINVGNREAAAAILSGYRAGLDGPRPVLLEELETWMGSYLSYTGELRRKYWTELEGYPDATPPPAVRRSLESCLPDGASVLRFASRVKGGGGLGRPRYLVIAMWRGGRIVREAKALVPSAWDWAHGTVASPRCLELATGRFRSPDPFLRVTDGFIIRRIAPDSRKIELSDEAGAELNLKMLRIMGFDLGAIHAAEPDVSERIRRDLDGRQDEWLHTAAKAAVTAVEQDFAEWTR